MRAGRVARRVKSRPRRKSGLIEFTELTGGDLFYGRANADRSHQSPIGVSLAIFANRGVA